MRCLSSCVFGHVTNLGVAGQRSIKSQVSELSCWLIVSNFYDIPLAMDEPVTDIKFMSDVDHCPEGYNIVSRDLKQSQTCTAWCEYTKNLTKSPCVLNLQVTKCPCDHDAQLWEKVIGGESGKRYLCFTRDKTVGNSYHTFERSACELINNY